MEKIIKEKDENAVIKAEESDVTEDSIVGSVPTKDLNIEDSQNHRQNPQYSSESSDFETDESSDSEEFLKNLRKNVVSQPAKIPVVLKTKGELLPFELPPVEDLHITEDVANLQKIGKVLHIVIDKERNENFVIVESDANSSPLDENSVLFLASGEPLGKIHDIFGIVNKPNYSIRFNKPEDIKNKGVLKEQEVFYSPTNSELTNYVLVDDLKKQKGSDASWKDNNEPPADQIDYSDDEQEKLAKQKRRAKNRKNDQNWDSEEEDKDVAIIRVERKHEKEFQARTPRTKFRRSTSGPSRSTHSSPGSFSCASSPPHILSPSTCGPQRNVHTPQPSTSMNKNFLGRNVQSPQSFGPFPQSNVPNPTTFRPFIQSRVPTPQSSGTFVQNTVPLHQSFTAPSASLVFTPPRFTPSFVIGAPQQNPSSLMPSPQNNIPLQQQFLLQPQQATASFFSQPPPNSNIYQNPTTVVHQNRSFAPPMFGALPATVHTMPNISNQSFVSQKLYSFETRNGPPNDLSGNLNISQSGSITPINSNGHQNLSYSMGQSSTASSFIFSPGNTQHNMNSSFTTPVFGHNQSGLPSPYSQPPPFVLKQSTLPAPCPTSPFVYNQSPLPSPCPTPPFVLCPTPPPLPTQQGFPILSEPNSPVLPSQTLSPAINPFALRLPQARHPMSHQHYPYS